ncbi:hypothetical protein [Sulfurisphaera ohwakuensis]|uniref:Uncharacterized protein n=1 Tax=Sulfurisphaera ohwakuensis TaxID=69656 RepID=A0A650CKM1_SULOH|nr:hypothetical protein [Sulfurisphaera ohwakuensis]MBB5253719.1 hypothetical protein [Sulfurisphaera ohwakuensis]QGR18298.1 hypothetical protein D1869_14715 [Sulfurisphaera ohwakuensis]
MLHPILIAILSLGIVEGINPHKGLLFSSYFYSFKKRLESYLLPPVITTFYYLLGIIISLLVIIPHDPIFKLMLLNLVSASIIMKVICSSSNFLYYSGSMKPVLSNVIKWSLANSIIEMAPIEMIVANYLVNLGFIIFFLSNFVTREIAFYFCKNSVPRKLYLYNIQLMIEIPILILLLIGIILT